MRHSCFHIISESSIISQLEISIPIRANPLPPARGDGDGDDDDDVAKIFPAGEQFLVSQSNDRTCRVFARGGKRRKSSSSSQGGSKALDFSELTCLKFAAAGPGDEENPDAPAADAEPVSAEDREYPDLGFDMVLHTKAPSSRA
jgi:hypothetical protein